MTRKYWINTTGDKIVLLSLVNMPIDPRIQLLCKMKQCSWFVYHLYGLTRINLMAKDKFKWVRDYWRIKIYGS